MKFRDVRNNIAGLVAKTEKLENDYKKLHQKYFNLLKYMIDNTCYVLPDEYNEDIEKLTSGEVINEEDN